VGTVVGVADVVAAVVGGRCGSEPESIVVMILEAEQG